jgi:ubiquinone/menaquinone biosynthesis C-methylase UbiE
MDIVNNEFNGCIPRQKWFVNKIVSSTRGLTLDCGCGRGLWSKKLREKGLEVIGIDISEKRLKYAKVEGNNNLIICASCTHLPFKSNCFDSALLIEVIEHLNEENQETTLSEIRRVLKSEGTLIITTPNRPIYHLLAKYFHLFKYNPEHIKELSLWEVRNLVRNTLR